MGESSIKISIIVPVYNTSKYLKKCLNSIIKQSLKAIEIICINDGSTDESLKILEEYTELDDRIKIITQTNKGLSSARNRGIEIARGEYILHIDSDDWIDKGYFEKVYLAAKENNADIVITDFYYSTLGRETYAKDNTLKKEIDKIECINNIFLLAGKPTVWNKLIRTELYKKNKIRHPLNINLGEDLATIPLLIYNSNKIIKINEAYYHYVYNDNSITKEVKLDKIFQLLETLKINEKFFKKEVNINIYELKIHHLSGWIFRHKELYKNKKYDVVLEEYLEAVKHCNLQKIKFKKLKIYGKILKMINNREVLYFLFRIDYFRKNKFSF